MTDNPHVNEEIEFSTLATILDGRHKAAWGDFVELCGGWEVFFNRNHRLVALVCGMVAEAGTHIDAMTVAAAAQQITFGEGMSVLSGRKVKPERGEGIDFADSLLAGIGGFNTLADIAGGFAPIASYRARCQALADLARTRRVLAGLDAARERLAAPGGAAKLDAVVDEVVNLAASLGQTGQGYRTLDQHAGALLARHDAIRDGQVSDRRAVWGLPTLDRCMPLEPGGLYYLSATNGSGKTSLMLQTAMETSKALGPQSVAIVSLEMGGEQLASINLSRELGVPRRSIERGWLKADKRAEADEVRARWEASAMWIKDDRAEGATTISAIAAWARRMHQRSGGRLALLCLDYLQMVEAEGGRQDEFAKITAASRALKRLARQTGIAILALAQMTKAARSSERKGGKLQEVPEPQLTDLAGSAGMGNDADGVVFLWPTQVDQQTPTIQLHAKIAKNRAGAVKRFSVDFYKSEGQRMVEFDMHRRAHPEMNEPPSDKEDAFNG